MSAAALPETPALTAATVCEAFQLTAAARPDQVALRVPGGAVEITWREYAERAQRIAAGLAALGVVRGDTVGLMLVNRPEFHLVDAGAMHLGATPFSLYNSSSPEQIHYLLANAANRVMITEERFLPAIQAAREAGAAIALEHTVLVDGDEQDGVITLEQLEASGEPHFDFERHWRAVEPDDVLTLIYTSGTTGPPKGVQLTHRNIMATSRGQVAHMPFTPGGRTTSFLPSAHIADRWVQHYLCGITMGCTVTCVADPKTIVQHLPECPPTVWGSVPRIWEKVMAAFEARVFSVNPDARRALDAAIQKVRLEQAGERVPEPLAEAVAQADRALFAKLREQVGLHECEWLIVGAAPTPLPVLEFFAAIGLPLHEVWGMSETAAVATCNPLGRPKYGTCGTPLTGIVELRIADDGEVLVRGDSVMPGYRNDPEKTAEAIDGEGWLHTGDIGQIDEDGYLKIVDRKKEIIINAAGKNMSPANIEATIKSSSPLIGQAVAIGDGRPYNVALLVLDPDAAAAFAAEHELADDSAAAVARDQRVLAEVGRGIEAANAQLSRVEQIKRWRLLATEWLPGGEELTPTMKLKRKPIAARYAQEIEALYEA